MRTPASLEEALQYFESDESLREALGAEFSQAYLNLMRRSALQG